MSSSWGLPGLPFAPAGPARPAAEVVPAYFADYERAFDLDARRPVRVSAVRDAPPELLVETDRGTWRTHPRVDQRDRHLDAPVPAGLPRPGDVPRAPAAPGAVPRARGVSRAAGGGGRRRHVGGAAAAGDRARRRGHDLGDQATAAVRDGEFDAEAGRAAVARVDERVRAGLVPQSVVGVTGLARTPAVRAAQEVGVLDRRPMFDRIEPGGVAWADGTGSRPT